MITDDPHLIVRSASLYVVAMLTVVAWALRRPSRRQVNGAVLAFFWNVPAVLLLHLMAASFEWWQFDADGGLFLGMPIDLHLGWAWLWGALTAIAFPMLPLIGVTAIVLVFDLIGMPMLWPVLQLEPAWIAGEVTGLLVCVVPGQLLARWTARDTHLYGRVLLQMLTFAGLMLFAMPAAVIEGSGGRSRFPLDGPIWQLSVLVQVLVLPAILGLSAVLEFATRGGGTPVPFDPPCRFVTSGPYAYVRNPMQVSAAVLFVLMGVALQNWWLAAAGVMAHIYSSGLAGWDEEQDLRSRFGERWLAYRTNVRSWVPRWRPWHRPEELEDRLFVAGSCEMCSEVGAWFAARHSRGLAVVAAETHPSQALDRITYESGDYRASGVEAIARGLEHVHLGWAFVGFTLRLPVVCALAQLLVDACGGEARVISPNRGHHAVGRGVN
jgi:protein-S-isoprenylcysteine O-methyltransferase Ste14